MTQIKLRRDTAANFTSANPVLGIGEPAYETDTKKLKIGDGTTAYTQLEYFSAGGGGGSTNISATLPLKIVDGVISLEVDGQTIQIVDGKLHANLDELGNEVNNLSGRVAAAEANILTKQDILTPIQPLTIQNKIISNLAGMEYTGDATGVYGVYSLESNDEGFSSGNLGNNTNFGRSWTASSIPCYIDIPYTFGQIVKIPSGSTGDAYNKSIGKLLADGTFIPICTFYPEKITTSDTLKSFTQYQATWNTKYTTKTNGNTFSVANGQAGCSYIQFIDNGSTVRCLTYYGNEEGVPSISTNFTITDSNDIQRIREIQVVRVFPNRRDYGVSSNPYPVDRFGLYDGATTLDILGDFNNLGENLFDLSGQTTNNYLELNIGSGLTITDGKLTASSTVPTNMVTTDTAQTITGIKTFSTELRSLSTGITNDGLTYETKVGSNTRSCNPVVVREEGIRQIEVGDAYNYGLQLLGTTITDGSGNKFLTSGNVTAYVTEEFVDGTEGYRVWSNGRCEQWGNHVNNHTDITLLKTMKNNTYLVTGIALQYGVLTLKSQTTTSIQIWIGNSSSTEESFYWYLSGELGS